jgi:hypothetical protein
MSNRVRHMHSVDRPICEAESSIDALGSATRMIYGGIECPDCLRRAIAEAEERARVLRELLAKVEALS